jgi:homeobox protein cut-like
MTSKTTITEQWLKFDLKALQRDLDTKVIEIAQQQEEGDQSRKKLIELSKEFKKTASEDVRKTAAPTLKSFQSEIDSLSKRNKTLEQTFLALYKQLIELPDPSGLFENLSQLQKRAERVQDLEIENKQLRETLDEYNNEFAHVKNQEVTIKQLKEKIKDMEEKSEQTVQNKLKEKEKELTKQFGDRDEHFKSIQLDLVKKLGETETKNSNLQNQLQKLQTDMFELKLKQDEILNAKSSEIDLLLQDLDRANDRATNSERLLEQYMQNYKDQLENLAQNSSRTASANIQNSIDMITTSTLEIELAAKEKEISQLVDDIQKLQMRSNKAKELFENEKNNLEDKIARKDLLIKQLEEKDQQRNDYEEMKRELNILKSIEFNTLSIKSDDEQQKPLEVLLLEKNRSLQSENTQLKNQHSDLKSKYDDEKSQNLAVLKTIGEQKQLIAELERDLLSIAKGNQNSNKEKTNVALLDLNSIGNNDDASATSSLENNEINMNTINQENSQSLLNIVSSQRERFRIRIQELEMDSISNKQQLHILQSEIESLRGDNVKLYEKIRFLQSYNSNDRKFHKNSTGGPNGMSVNNDELVLNRYTNEYEQKLDPFSKFTRTEKQNRIQNLKIHDKFTLSFGRFILSSKTARFIFFLYFLIIHLLIFLSTYRIAHSESAHRYVSAECSELYKQHMHKVHGDDHFHLP